MKPTVGHGMSSQSGEVLVSGPSLVLALSVGRGGLQGRACGGSGDVR